MSTVKMQVIKVSIFLMMHLVFFKKIRDGNIMLEKSKKIKMSIHQI